MISAERDIRQPVNGGGGPVQPGFNGGVRNYKGGLDSSRATSASNSSTAGAAPVREVRSSDLRVASRIFRTLVFGNQEWLCLVRVFLLGKAGRKVDSSRTERRELDCREAAARRGPLAGGINGPF